MVLAAVVCCMGMGIAHAGDVLGSAQDLRAEGTSSPSRYEYWLNSFGVVNASSFHQNTVPGNLRDSQYIGQPTYWSSASTDASPYAVITSSVPAHIIGDNDTLKAIRVTWNPLYAATEYYVGAKINGVWHKLKCARAGANNPLDIIDVSQYNVKVKSVEAFGIQMISGQPNFFYMVEDMQFVVSGM